METQAVTRRIETDLIAPLPEGVRLHVAGRSLDVVRGLGEINLERIQHELSDAGGHSIWWGIMAAEAQAEHERAKIRCDLKRSEIAADFRRSKMQSQERITEAQVTEHIERSEDYQKAREAVI